MYINIYFRQFNELMIRGKGTFDRQDVITALTTCAGNVDMAFAELTRPPPPAPSNSPPPPPTLDESSLGIHVTYIPSVVFIVSFMFSV